MTLHKGRISFLFALLAVVPPSHAQSESSSLKQLADSHRWRELRDAAAKDKNAMFYQAIGAAVFNEPQAEQLFRSVIEQHPGSEEAYQSYDWLANIYLKSGRYQSLTKIMQARWTNFPNKKDVASEKKETAPFNGLPDQQTTERKRSTLHHDKNSLAVTLSINNKPAKFFFDDGADFSCISEQEARALRMDVHAIQGSTNSMTKATSFRMATAREVIIGGMHFKDVSFAVFPDNQEPWSLVPLRQRGIIGLPLMIATGVFHWKADGTITIGEEPRPLNVSQANMFLDAGKRPVLKVSFLGKDFWTALDTGAMTTDVYAPFAHLFADYLKQNGKPGQNEIRGIGGAESFTSINLPSLTLQIDRHDVILKPAHILTNHTERRDWIFANVSKDLLMQTSGFTIDFQAMTLMIE